MGPARSQPSFKGAASTDTTRDVGFPYMYVLGKPTSESYYKAFIATIVVSFGHLTRLKRFLVVDWLAWMDTYTRASPRACGCMK